MFVSTPLCKVVIAVLVVLVSHTVAGAIDLGYESTRSLRGVAIPRLTLRVSRMPDPEWIGQMATKVRFSDGQNWITLQLGHFGPETVQHGADLRIVYKRVGYATTTLTIGRTQPKSFARLRKVVQSTTGVTFTIYWQPAGQAYQEITRRIAIPWAGAEQMRCAVSIPDDAEAARQAPDVLLWWTASYGLDTTVATADWLRHVGWRIIPGSDDPQYTDDTAYLVFSCTSTGTGCRVESQE